MPTDFPTGLDSFIKPTSPEHLLSPAGEHFTIHTFTIIQVGGT